MQWDAVLQYSKAQRNQNNCDVAPRACLAAAACIWDTERLCCVRQAALFCVVMPPCAAPCCAMLCHAMAPQVLDAEDADVLLTTLTSQLPWCSAMS
jgi:hypothetical protein